MKTLTHEYVPRGTCREMFEDRSPEVLMSGPAGTGKSRACLEKLHLQRLIYPNSKGLIIRKVRETLSSTALDTWRKFVIKEGLLAGDVDFYGGSKEEPAQYRYSNGSVVHIAGLDNPTKIMSSEYDSIFFQEAIEGTITDWENLTTRLRNGMMPYSQLLADTNPGAPTHWLKQRCDAGITKFYNSKHSDNPILMDDKEIPTERGLKYLQRLDALTGVRRKRLRDGLWVAAEGMIYEAEWDASKHIIDPFPIPWDWPRYWSIDFGYVHPFVLQCWALGPENKLYMYREIYHTKRTVAEHCARILGIVNPRGEREWIEPRPRRIICDHDAENRAQLERELRAGTAAARKEVKAGIQAVQKRMAADGLYLMRNVTVDIDQEQREAGNPTCTIEEIPGYIWDMVMGKVAKESPVKLHDDGCDALRYIAMHLDRREGVPVRML